ncbi:hypothetical protein LIER_26471 [Lithospermum erythrorhizon]|uniref:Uncharacterized protein n=1 Tax=Lithospermum erythrorhizon TaxID=34254 RepID=A0AAV3RC51_LITER
MSSAQSCKSLEQRNQYIDFCNYNIKAWTNCLHELQKKREELEASEGKQESIVGSRLRKRKTSGHGNEESPRKSPKIDGKSLWRSLRQSDGKSPRLSPKAGADLVYKMKKPHGKTPKKKKIDEKRGKEKLVEDNDASSDFEELKKLLHECDILQEDKNEEVKGMVKDFEIQKSKDLKEVEDKRRCSNRETKKSKFKKTPFREKVKTIIPTLSAGDKKLLDYAYDKKKGRCKT